MRNASEAIHVPGTVGALGISVPSAVMMEVGEGQVNTCFSKDN